MPTIATIPDLDRFPVAVALDGRSSTQTTEIRVYCPGGSMFDLSPEGARRLGTVLIELAKTMEIAREITALGKNGAP